MFRPFIFVSFRPIFLFFHLNRISQNGGYCSFHRPRIFNRPIHLSPELSGSRPRSTCSSRTRGRWHNVSLIGRNFVTSQSTAVFDDVMRGTCLRCPASGQLVSVLGSADDRISGDVKRKIFVRLRIPHWTHLAAVQLGLHRPLT